DEGETSKRINGCRNAEVSRRHQLSRRRIVRIRAQFVSRTMSRGGRFVRSRPVSFPSIERRSRAFSSALCGVISSHVSADAKFVGFRGVNAICLRFTTRVLLWRGEKNRGDYQAI